MPTVVEIHRAASEVIVIPKGIADYSDAKVAVIGGIGALGLYLEWYNYRGD